MVWCGVGALTCSEFGCSGWGVVRCGCGGYGYGGCGGCGVVGVVWFGAVGAVCAVPYVGGAVRCGEVCGVFGWCVSGVVQCGVV